MKLLFITILCLPLVVFSQKANDDVIKTSYHHIIYPKNESLSSKKYCLTVNENLSCFGTIPGRIHTTPMAEAEPRSAFYLGLIPNQPKYFTQSRDVEAKMRANKEDFIKINMETSDIYLTNQTTKIAMQSGTNLYYLNIEMVVKIDVKISHEGETSTTLLDTNANNFGHRVLDFPMNAIFGMAAPDIKLNGYPTEAELLSAWKKYSPTIVKNWRDKYITEFASPIFIDFKNNNITHEEWTNCKIYSDKNKKGGYDQIVDAAMLFTNAINTIDVDFKNNDFKKFWKQEYQENFVKAGKIWSQFLSDSNFDVLADDNLISDDYRQRILLNYIHALIFTGNFDKANEMIGAYSKQKLRPGPQLELSQLKILNNRLKEEFNVHAIQYGWVKSAEVF